MNTRRLIAGLAAAAVLLGVSSGAYAHGHGRYSSPAYAYAKVLSARPVIYYVNVRRPVQECWQDTEYYTVDNRRHRVRGSKLVGAIVGGVIGHQFGSGRGNDVATAAGAIIGANIGGDIARHRDTSGYSSTRYSRPVQRCETRYRDYREERIDGYDVVYRYRGQTYSTRMSYDPGRKMKVRTDIRQRR
ncbi:MAG: glycine zipper 2TM domain-containing protein [Desulfobulbaceae bacterium]|nr:glycine zipper 2TM domain-containing protein [Desulfobulbaceae bacterium]